MHLEGQLSGVVVSAIIERRNLPIEGLMCLCAMAATFDLAAEAIADIMSSTFRHRRAWREIALVSRARAGPALTRVHPACLLSPSASQQISRRLQILSSGRECNQSCSLHARSNLPLLTSPHDSTSTTTKQHPALELTQSLITSAHTLFWTTQLNRIIAIASTALAQHARSSTRCSDAPRPLSS